MSVFCYQQGGTLKVEDASYFFKYLFDDLWPGTVFTITLSVELEELGPDGETNKQNSIEVLTCEYPVKTSMCLFLNYDLFQ